jgi:hypothetical protein
MVGLDSTPETVASAGPFALSPILDAVVEPSASENLPRAGLSQPDRVTRWLPEAAPRAPAPGDASVPATEKPPVSPAARRWLLPEIPTPEAEDPKV